MLSFHPFQFHISFYEILSHLQGASCVEEVELRTFSIVVAGISACGSS